MLSIIIPVHNQIRVTKECVRSIVERTKVWFEIIIVNDQSNEEETPQFKELALEYGCKYIETQSQGWHSGACNLGMQHAKGDYICLLNSDTVVGTNWAKHMIDFLKSDRAKDCSFVGPSTSYGASHQNIPSCCRRRYETSYDKVNEYAKAIELRFKEQIVITRLTGFCLLFTRSVYDLLGQLDHDMFPSGGNEMDWQLRGLVKGLKPYWVRSSYVHHLGEISYAHAMDIKVKREQWKEADLLLIDKHGEDLFDQIHKWYWRDQRFTY